MRSYLALLTILVWPSAISVASTHPIKRERPKTCRKSRSSGVASPSASATSIPAVVAYNSHWAGNSPAGPGLATFTTSITTTTTSINAIPPSSVISPPLPPSKSSPPAVIESEVPITTQNTGKSSKMGISWAIGERTIAPVKAFFGEGSKVSWWWNWNKNYDTKLFPGDSTKVSIDSEFVPMLFDYTFLTNSDPLEPGYKAVQGWNEPDMKGMDPVEAGGKWKALVQAMREKKPDVKLWSPAPAHDKEWMVKFLKTICPSGMEGCDVVPDYLNMRIYNTNIKTFKSQLTEWHDKFGMEIVVGEFACDVLGGGEKGVITAESVSAFMRDIVPWMEGTSWIYRYSWFGGGKDPISLNDVDQHNALMDSSGQLTALGKQYVRGGM